MTRALPALVLVAVVGCGSTEIVGLADSSTDASGDTPRDPGSDPSHDATSIPGDCVSVHGWEEVHLPEVAGDEPAAEIVGESVKISVEDHRAGGRPAVVWTGSEWGVAWTDPMSRTVFRRLSPDGVTVGLIKVVDPSIDASNEAPALVWAHGSYAFGIAEVRLDGIHVGVLDASGDLAHGPSLISTDAQTPDIAGYEAVPGYLVTWSSTSDTDFTHVYVAHIDESGALTGPAQHVVWTLRYHDPRIAAFCEMASITYLREEYDLWQKTFEWPVATLGPDATFVGPVLGLHRDTHHTAVPFRDSVVVAWHNGSGTSTLVYDPQTGEPLHGPTIVDLHGLDGWAGVAPAHDRGFLGLCFQGVSQLQFLIIGPDGTAVGSPLTIPSPAEVYSNNAIAWSGSEFLVIYKASRDLFAQRVRPLI